MVKIDRRKPANEDINPPEVKELDKEEKKVILDRRERLEKAKGKFKTALESRRRYDWEWLARDLFRRGYQFTRYNPANKTVILATKKATHIPVNLVAAHMRVIRNSVTAFRPKWEVLPAIGEEANEDARYSEKILDYIYRKMNVRKMIKELVTQGLVFSVGGPWQFGWDDTIENDDGSKGDIFIWANDPFDFFIDPNCTDGLEFSDAEYVVKAIKKPLAEVRANPNYNFTPTLITGEARLAASEYKQFLLQSLKMVGQSQMDESETVILHEGYFKERDENGKISMRIIHWIDQLPEPLLEQVEDTSEFPFCMYQADVNPLEVYGEGWARHTIAINRVINALESSMFDYNYKYAKGRLVVDKNSGIRAITNEHGSIIEKNRGAEVHSLPLASLPPSVENQISRLKNYFEDISGAHDPMLGRVPTGVTSGIGIAELKQADATNQADLVDNLEDFLISAAHKILNLMAKHYTEPRIMKITGQAGKSEYFAAVGEDYVRNKEKTKYAIGKTKYPLAKIHKNNEIAVSVGSWLAFSKEQRKADLLKLYEVGLLDQKSTLENLEFGDIENILSRVRQEKILREQGGEPTPEGQTSGEEVAVSENEMMLEGRTDVTPHDNDNHQVHNAVHTEALGKGKDDIIQAHMQQHEMMMGQGQGMPQQEQQQLPPEMMAMANIPASNMGAAVPEGGLPI